MGLFETVALMILSHSMIAAIFYKAGRNERAAGGQDE